MRRVQVLEELSQDPTLARFRMEYAKLHSALQRSHHNERRLMDKCRELQAEIASHSAEVATALKLASDDKQTIDALKKVGTYNRKHHHCSGPNSRRVSICKFALYCLVI